MSAKLKNLEKKIEGNQKAAWYENKLILLKIRNEKLYKKKYGTFEKYLEDRWGYEKRRGYQLMKSAEFMQIAEKNMAEKVNKKSKFVHLSKPILPKNEGQVRPLIEKLEHNGQRIKVWAEVVGTGEKITAELVQTKVDEFLASGEEVPDIEYIETDIDLNGRILAAKFTGDEESYTPTKYIEKARMVMGSIDTDPASNNMAQETVKAGVYYDIHNDGLNKKWDGNIWLNPPYTLKIIDRFIAKLINELDNNAKQAILLTNNNTDTQWFLKAAKACSLICFTTGRIKFDKRDGTTSSPTNGQAFFYFGENTEAFKREFDDIGLVMRMF